MRVFSFEFVPETGYEKRTCDASRLDCVVAKEEVWVISLLVSKIVLDLSLPENVKRL